MSFTNPANPANFWNYETTNDTNDTSNSCPESLPRLTLVQDNSRSTLGRRRSFPPPGQSMEATAELPPAKRARQDRRDQDQSQDFQDNNPMMMMMDNDNDDNDEMMTDAGYEADCDTDCEGHYDGDWE